MDTAASDRRLIERILFDSAKVPYSQGDYRLQTDFDRDRDHDLLLIVGWDGIRREHGCLVHVDLIDGKFWIQRDGTESRIAQELLDAGVPGSRIVLAFRSLEKRRLTDCAVT
ncbi:MAG TPA: XisI protein [Isosphaeraceae bacterium]|nr:XisI protein [Isosphaeraceae bacterium]